MLRAEHLSNRENILSFVVANCMVLYRLFSHKARSVEREVQNKFSRAVTLRNLLRAV